MYRAGNPERLERSNKKSSLARNQGGSLAPCQHISKEGWWVSVLRFAVSLWSSDFWLGGSGVEASLLPRNAVGVFELLSADLLVAMVAPSHHGPSVCHQPIRCRQTELASRPHGYYQDEA